MENDSKKMTYPEDFVYDTAFDASGRVLAPKDSRLFQTQGGSDELKGLMTIDALSSWFQKDEIRVSVN